jgi:hypothetical protein
LNSFHTHFIIFPLSCSLYAMPNNWSPNLQMWCDLLNTSTLQAPPISDEFTDASPIHHQSNASPTPRPSCSLSTTSVVISSTISISISFLSIPSTYGGFFDGCSSTISIPSSSDWWFNEMNLYVMYFELVCIIF